MKASIFPSAKSSSGLAEGSVTQPMSLSGSSPTWGSHQPEQCRRSQLATDGLALQIRNRVNIPRREQLKAADMDARQHRDRLPGVDRGSKQHRKIQSEIDFALGNRSRQVVGRRIHIADIDKALGA
jgi:hypothetical protein